MRITRLTLKNWRNFKDADVTLQKRVFLAGPNASGKSNLLDAIRFLQEVASVGGGLGSAADDRGGVSSVRSLHAHRNANVFIGIEIGENPQRPVWSYSLEFNQDINRIPIVKGEIVKKKGVVLLDRDVMEESIDPELLTQTHLEQVHMNKEFRRVADFLKSIRYLHIVPQLVREPDRSTGKTNDPFGGDFLEQLARFQQNNEKSFDIRLKKLNLALQFAVPYLKELSFVRGFNRRPHLEGQFENWRRGAGKLQENDFSDGTLRLFGLLWAILDSQGPLLFEEPEISLHPAVVQYIPQMFARVIRAKGKCTQIIVSTHSVDIFNDTGIGADEVLLLNSSIDGTIIEPANNLKEISDILKNGLPLSDIVIARTAPKDSSHLQLFGED
jgi:predicted ATPase